MSTLEELAQRVARLEELVEVGEESLSPGVYSINAKGEVEAKISGTLEASGIIFQEATGAGVATASIRWLDAGKVESVIQGYRSAAGVHTLGLAAEPDAGNHASVFLNAAPFASTGHATVQIEALGESEPARLNLSSSEAGGTNATLAVFSGTEIGELVLQALAETASAEVTFGGSTLTLLDQLLRSNFPQIAALKHWRLSFGQWQGPAEPAALASGDGTVELTAEGVYHVNWSTAWSSNEYAVIAIANKWSTGGPGAKEVPIVSVANRETKKMIIETNVISDAEPKPVPMKMPVAMIALGLA